MTAVACANDDDERISTGVGFGKVVSAKAREENGATIVPSMSQILQPWGRYSLAAGDWMKLGDEFGADVASQIISQQLNIALMSALLLTIQFSFMYALQQLWDNLIDSSYLASLMDEGQTNIIYEAFVITCLSSVVVNCMCMVYCVLVSLTLGEIAGRTEANFLNETMGKYLSGSLPLFILSIALWAFKCVLYQMVACRTLPGVVVTAVSAVAIAAAILVVFYARIIRQAYLVKHMAGVVRPDAAAAGALPLWASPLHASHADLEADYLKFAGECGLRCFSESNFLEYVTYAARARADRAVRGSPPTPEQRAAMRVAELCDVSRLMLSKFAAAKVEELAAAEMLATGEATAEHRRLRDWLRARAPPDAVAAAGGADAERAVAAALAAGKVTAGGVAALTADDVKDLGLPVGYRRLLLRTLGLEDPPAPAPAPGPAQGGAGDGAAAGGR